MELPARLAEFCIEYGVPLEMYYTKEGERDCELQIRMVNPERSEQQGLTALYDMADNWYLDSNVHQVYVLALATIQTIQQQYPRLHISYKGWD